MKIVASLVVGLLLGFAVAQLLKLDTRALSNSPAYAFSGVDIEGARSELTALEFLKNGDSQSAQLVLAATLNMRVNIARKSSVLGEQEKREVEALAIEMQPHNIRLGLDP